MYIIGDRSNVAVVRTHKGKMLMILTSSFSISFNRSSKSNLHHFGSKLAYVELSCSGKDPCPNVFSHNTDLAQVKGFTHIIAGGGGGVHGSYIDTNISLEISPLNSLYSSIPTRDYVKLTTGVSFSYKPVSLWSRHVRITFPVHSCVALPAVHVPSFSREWSLT